MKPAIFASIIVTLLTSAAANAPAQSTAPDARRVALLPAPLTTDVIAWLELPTARVVLGTHSVAAGGAGQVPPALPLNGTLHIYNNSSHAIQVAIGGDGTQWTFQLSGPSVGTASPVGNCTDIYFVPRQQSLAVGGSVDIPIARLEDSDRCRPRRQFWQAPGQYTLRFEYQTTYATPSSPGSTGSVPGSAGTTLRFSGQTEIDVVAATQHP